MAGFEREDDARRFLDAMRARLEEFELTLHTAKTRLIEFGRMRRLNVSSADSESRKPLRSWGSRSSAANHAKGASSFNGRPVATACEPNSARSKRS